MKTIDFEQEVTIAPGHTMIVRVTLPLDDKYLPKTGFLHGVMEGDKFHIREILVEDFRPIGEPLLSCKPNDRGIIERESWGHPMSLGGNGGYINKYGRRVPNPCSEIDTKGRNMSKIYRNLRPEDNDMDEETLDRLNNLVDEHPLARDLNFKKLYGPNNDKSEVPPTT